MQILRKVRNWVRNRLKFYYLRRLEDQESREKVRIYRDILRKKIPEFDKNSSDSMTEFLRDFREFSLRVNDEIFELWHKPDDPDTFDTFYVDLKPREIEGSPPSKEPEFSSEFVDSLVREILRFLQSKTNQSSD